MDNPQTKKQQKNKDKNAMEYKRSGKGARAIISNQERNTMRQNNKKR